MQGCFVNTPEVTGHADLTVDASAVHYRNIVVGSAVAAPARTCEVTDDAYTVLQAILDKDVGSPMIVAAEEGQR